MRPGLLAALCVVVVLAGCGSPARGPATGDRQRQVEPTSVLEPIDLGTPLPRDPTETPIPHPTNQPSTQIKPTAAALPLVGANPAPTATRGPSTTSAANLRSGPGTLYNVVGGLAAGSTLAIAACNPDYTWYKLADGRWIFAELVANGQCPRVETNIPLPPTATPRPKPVEAAPVPFVAPPPTARPPAVVYPTSPPAPPARSCCKVCTGSKACGNSCISSSKTCHQPPGCACQG